MWTRLLSLAQSALLSDQCPFCLSESSDLLCKECLADLPSIRYACESCALPLLSPGIKICGECLKQPPAFDKTICAYSYAGKVPTLIHSFKHQNKLPYGKLLCTQLQKRIHAAYESSEMPTLITYVPNYWTSPLAGRFGQAEQMSHTLALRFRLQHIRALRKVRSTGQQKKLSKIERKQNLVDAYSVINHESIEHQHIALVDDVMTTGTTMNTLAKLLKEQGVTRVDCWALARTPKKVSK